MIESGKSPRHQLSLVDQDYPQDSPRGSSETSLRDFIGILRRRKAIAIQTFIVILAMAAVVTFLTKPLYRSTASLLVEGKASMVALTNTTDPLTGIFLPPAGHEVSTQVEILRSPRLLEKVCKDIGTTPREVSLDVRQVGDTDVIELGVTSPNRNLAQRFATQMPQVYLQDIRASRLHEVNSALNFARKRLKERNAQLAQAELKLEKFRNKAGVVDPEAQQTQDITAANAAQALVRQAEADAASARARLAELQSARRSLPRFVESPTTTSNNQEIGALQERVDNLQSERKKLLFLYKPDQPEVRRVDREIADLQQRLAKAPRQMTTTSRTVNPMLATADQNVADASAAASAAQASLDAARSRAARLTSSLPGYNTIMRSESQLVRSIEDGRNSVQMLAKSVEDLSLRQKAVESKDDPITVIAAAGPALQVAPRVFRNMIMAIILGLFLAAAAALLHDSLDDHINDEEEARWLLDTPILGHLPMLPDADRHLISLEASDARILENFRVLRSNVQFTLMNRTNHALMVTSTIPAEGKTSTASNLAIAMALDGRRIILVDADLHRPQLDGLFGLAKQPGLSNVLVGQAALQDALQATDIPGLRVLTCGVLPPNPAELLNSQAMDELLEAMKADSDMVIFDSPPCLATADAQVLSAKVDGVVYVMELGKVHKSSVQRSFELFHQAQARVLGVVFNKIESSNRDSYTYYDYGYYGDGHGKSAGGDDKAIAGPEKKILPHRRANGTNAEAAATSNGSSANGDRGHSQVAGDDKQEL